MAHPARAPAGGHSQDLRIHTPRWRGRARSFRVDASPRRAEKFKCGNEALADSDAYDARTDRTTRSHQRRTDESDQRGILAAATSATSKGHHFAKHISTHGRGHRGGGSEMGRGKEACTEVHGVKYPAAGPEGSSWCRSRSRSGRSKATRPSSDMFPKRFALSVLRRCVGRCCALTWKWRTEASRQAPQRRQSG